MTAVVDTAALNHLGAVIQRIRPQWDTPGITDALTRALTDHPYPDVATVAISSARDPQAKTPAVIVHRCRNGWTATPHDDVQRTHTPERLHTCKRCGAYVTELDHSQHCMPRAVDQHDARQRAFDAAEESTR